MWCVPTLPMRKTFILAFQTRDFRIVCHNYHDSISSNIRTWSLILGFQTRGFSIDFHKYHESHRSECSYLVFLVFTNDLVLSQTHVLLYGFILHCHVGSDLVLSQAVQAWRLFMKPKFFSISPSAFMWHFISFVHDLVLSRKHLAILIGMLRARCKLEPTIIIEELGEGRIRATWGWISVDRGSKATLPLTMPRRVFKSSAKDSAHRPLGRELRGGRPRHIGRTGLANGTGPWGRKRP